MCVCECLCVSVGRLCPIYVCVWNSQIFPLLSSSCNMKICDLVTRVGCSAIEAQVCYVVNVIGVLSTPYVISDWLFAVCTYGYTCCRRLRVRTLNAKTLDLKCEASSPTMNTK